MPKISELPPNAPQALGQMPWEIASVTYRCNIADLGSVITYTSAGILAGLGYTPVNQAGDTMTGYLILNNDPVNVLGAATKQYVDNTIAGAFTVKVLSAAGTNQGTATLIADDVNIVTTVGSGQGVRLPASSGNHPRRVTNYGANPLLVYPNSGGTINGGSTNAGVTLAVNGSVQFSSQNGTAWYVT